MLTGIIIISLVSLVYFFLVDIQVARKERSIEHLLDGFSRKEHGDGFLVFLRVAYFVCVVGMGGFFVVFYNLMMT